MFGCIMPAPFAMPSTVTVLPPSFTAAVDSFGKVSVVMMARAASSQPSGLIASGRAFRPPFIASMFIGNILALLQKNVKRVLAYSSIAHLGYLLVAFLAAKTYAFTAVAFYLVAYFVTTLGAFGIITVVSSGERDADMIDDYSGMAWRRPWLAAIFTAMLLSLAGIPLTAGFIGKFYVLKAGAGSSLWLLVIILIINSAIGLAYYLRVVISMFKHTSADEDPALSPGTSFIDAMALALLAFLLFWIGTYPSLFIDIIQSIGSSVG